MTTQEPSDLLARRSATLGQSYRLFYEEPIHVVRGVGVEVFDAEGRRFLDAYNNVPIVGHCNPRVVQAQCDQAALLNSHTRYLGEGVVRYAEKLLATMDTHLGRAIFTCTGSEAIDLALRMVQLPGLPHGVIVTENAYHGVTMAAAAVSPSLRSGLISDPWVRTVRVPRGLPQREAGDYFAAQVRDAIEDLEQSEYGFGALLVDMALASDGIFLEPRGFLSQACDIAQRAGGIVIADEVQAGFGRTGAAMWGHQYHGLRPDLVVMGKSMANGLPVGGVVGTEALMHRFAEQGRYFNTYGGNPVCMAAAEAVLDVIHDDDLIRHADRVGTHLLNELRNVCSPYAGRVEVRGAGLFAGVEFRDRAGQLDPIAAHAVLNGFRQHGILVGQCGPGNSAIKIRPPLPFTESDVDELVAALALLLSRLDGGIR